jgi:hypothetical protein
MLCEKQELNFEAFTGFEVLVHPEWLLKRVRGREITVAPCGFERIAIN